MSISAHDWVSMSSVDAEVFERWPDYRAILLAADAVDLASLAPVADRLLADAHEFARGLDQGEPDAHVARWHEAYRDFGVKPRVGRVSVDALVRRAVTEAGLPSIGVLVDLYNAVSILQHVPIGGEDLDRYDGPARLTIAIGAEPFHTTANGEAVVDHPDAGEPVWVDGGGVTCRRWNWRQTSRTAIHDDTRAVGFIIDSLDAPDHAGAHRAADRLAELVAAASVRVIDASTR